MYKRQGHHLIRKLSRHYSHEIAVACIMRGVNNITEFQMLLMEFAALRKKKDDSNGEYNTQVQPKQEQKGNVGLQWQHNKNE